MVILNKTSLFPSWMDDVAVRQVMYNLFTETEARFVGGCVRDALLGNESSDIDIATTVLPERVIERCEALGIRTIPTGLKHGTVTVLAQGRPFEVTTLRRDVSCDGRHAEVVFTDSWEEDAARRDFTFNAISLDRKGNVYDYFNGRDDLSKGIVRFIGDAESRIKEDYLRILRMFRFQAWFGKESLIEAQCALSKTYASQLQTLSGERIQHEFKKLLQADQSPDILDVMAEYDVLNYVFPDYEACDTAVLRTLITQMKYPLRNDVIVRIGALLYGLEHVDFAYVKQLSQHWKLSNKDTARLRCFVEHNGRVMPSTPSSEQKRLIRKLGKSVFEALVLLHWSCVPEDKAAYQRMLRFAKEYDVPVFPVQGDDLLSLGYREGKKLGECLQKLEHYWEQHDYRPTQKELLEYAAEKVPLD